MRVSLSNTSSTCFRTELAFAFALALDFAHLRSDVFGGVAPAHGSALGVPQGKALKDVSGLEIRSGVTSPGEGGEVSPLVLARAASVLAALSPSPPDMARWGLQEQMRALLGGGLLRSLGL